LVLPTAAFVFTTPPHGIYPCYWHLAAISIVDARDWPDQRHTRSLYPWRQKRRRARDPGAHECGV